jgi:tRNA(Ile)-lysidine synthetase-like protein
MTSRDLTTVIKNVLCRFCSLDEQLLVAVSGGSDSLSLLHLTAMVWPRHQVKVAFVDHGLRHGVDAEWALVKSQCDELGVVSERLFIIEEFTKTSDGDGLQQWARDRRYQLLADAAKRFACGLILTGHTMDDQAETVLLRLLRGTGLDGLGAIPISRKMPGGVTIIRPLLELQRQQLRDWLTSRSIPWADDPSNVNMRFARVQARNLMPELIRSNPRIREHLSALAEEARDVTHWIDDVISERLIMKPLRIAGGYRIDSDVLKEIPVSIHGRLVRHALQVTSGDLRRFERTHIAAIISGINMPGRSRRYVLPGEIQVWTAYGSLYVFSQTIPNNIFAAQKLENPTSNIWRGDHGEMRVSIKITVSTDVTDSGQTGNMSDWMIRPLQVGDRIWGSERKAMRLLVKKRIPVMYRPTVPALATPSGEIISIPGILNSRISGLRMEWHLHDNCVLKDLGRFQEQLDL